ncbi:MAG: N-acetyltransferase [marine bacterium B5-7]|nr:MAG: N-acetyltransferase [marine bacterium B5-7]
MPVSQNDTNEFGQTVGYPVTDFMPPLRPSRTEMQGRFCSVVPIDTAAHGDSLFNALCTEGDDQNWTYLPYGPFENIESFREWMHSTCEGDDPMFHSVIDHATERAVGVASYLRINQPAASIEVGHIHYSPLMQKTPLATEAMYLMMKRVFELGYRRYEWKCNALNRASRNAAMRFGFSFEGVFRQMLVTKERNRDTAWYACIDHEWPQLKSAYERWLDADNFDADGVQKCSLAELTAPVLVNRG